MANEKKAPEAAPKKDPYPKNEPGAVMKDTDGNEVFVASRSTPKVIDERLKLGWKMVEDRRPAPPKVEE